MKNISVISFLLISIFCALVHSQSHSVQWGRREVGDVLLHREIVKVSRKFLRIVTKDILFPPQGAPGVRKITFINAIDQYQDGNGGYASVLSGGAGYDHVKLHLKSKRSHGLNFIIEIYGQRW